MVHVTSSVTVDHPAPAVFAFVADAERNPDWQGGMRSCRWTTRPPVAVGSVYEQEAAFLGRPVRSTFEVVALDPGRSLTITTTESTFPIRVTRTVTPLGPDRCRVDADVSGGPGGVARLIDPLLRVLVGRSVRADYSRLPAALDDHLA